jgi:predicted RNA binding protein YcfA (HicA-like mRNA interferase family)
MPKFSSISGKRLLKILGKLGYVLDHVQGSHHILRNSGGKKVTIPIHSNTELPKGTLRGILSDLDISKKEFENLTRKG